MQKPLWISLRFTCQLLLSAPVFSSWFLWTETECSVSPGSILTVWTLLTIRFCRREQEIRGTGLGRRSTKPRKKTTSMELWADDVENTQGQAKYLWCFTSFSRPSLATWGSRTSSPRYALMTVDSFKGFCYHKLRVSLNPYKVQHLQQIEASSTAQQYSHQQSPSLLNLLLELFFAFDRKINIYWPLSCHSILYGSTLPLPITFRGGEPKFFQLFPIWKLFSVPDDPQVHSLLWICFTLLYYFLRWWHWSCKMEVKYGFIDSVYILFLS